MVHQGTMRERENQVRERFEFVSLLKREREAWKKEKERNGLCVAGFMFFKIFTTILSSIVT